MHMHQCTIAHSGKTQGDDNTPISCKISLPMLLLTGRMIEKTHFSFITTLYDHKMGLLFKEKSFEKKFMQFYVMDHA